jgi:hypothetical protein
MDKLTKTLALITLTIVTLSVIPVGLALIALPVRAQEQIRVVSMESSRVTGTFFNNTIFYVLIDIGPVPTPPVNISVAIRAPSTDGRYYTYSINASQIGTTLTYIVWFNVDTDGYLYWNATNATSIEGSKPTEPNSWVRFIPPVQYTTPGQYLDIIAGGKTLRLTYSPSEPVIGGYPTEWYAPTSKRSLKDWWILAHDLNRDPLEVDEYPEIINVSIYVDDRYISSVKLDIMETGANTGNFTVVEMIGQLPDVDPGKVMNLTFYIPKHAGITLYTGGDTANYWVKSILIKVLPAPPITLVTDRDYIPLSPYGDVRVYVNVTDPYAGAGPVNVSIRVWNFTKDVTSEPDKGGIAIVSEDWVDKGPGTYFNVTLYKCDAILFCGNFSVNAPNLGPEFVRGKVVINYTGYDGTTKLEKPLPLTTCPVKLSVNATEVKYGDVIEITLVDPYWNFNTTEKNTVPIDFIKFSGNKSPVTAYISELSETDVNTNVFKGTLRIDGYLADPGVTITLTYTNKRSPLTTPDATDWITEDVVVSFKVLSFTGKVVTDKDVYGPYGKMIIYVEDWDANKKINELDYVNITIQRWDGKFIPILNIKETDKSTGVFKYELKLPDELGVSAEVLVGKVIRIMYRDPVDATGKPYTAIKEVSFTSWDPEISTDKKFYNIGEKILITVKDLDANKDPGALDVIIVTVTSTSDPIGTRVTLVETGVNTGVFTGEVLVSDTIGTGRIYAKFGDVISITYVDDLPADYGVTGKSKAFTYTVNVGIPVEKPITPKKADFIDPKTGVPVIPKVGSMVGISVELSNVGVTDQVFTAILVVKDPEGVVVKVDSISIPLAAGKSGTVTFSYIPKLVGDYTVEVYVVKSLADWTPLGDMLTKVMSVVS